MAGMYLIGNRPPLMVGTAGKPESYLLWAFVGGQAGVFPN